MSDVSLNYYFGLREGLTDNSKVVVVLFLRDEQLQTYVDIYNETPSITLPSNNVSQYIVNNATLPVIDGSAQTIFNNTLFELSLTFSGTSNLWNETREYLTNKYNTPTTSFGTPNALKMIEYILAGKDIKLLGSHTGVLQFKPLSRTLSYLSALLTQYQKSTNTFNNYSIDFTDPLLGTFTATFLP